MVTIRPFFASVVSRFCYWIVLPLIKNQTDLLFSKPMNLNSPACCSPVHQVDHDQHHKETDLSPDRSLSSAPYHVFFGSNQDHMRGLDHCMFLHPQHQSDENCELSQGGSSSSETKNNGLKLTLWTMEDEGHVDQMSNNSLPSNIERIEKTKEPMDYIPIKITSTHTAKHEDQKIGPSLDPSSSRNSSYNSILTRVCVDCNTSKTPLWRSGPKGPKSLCNACGIRQRKARQAAAAAAASNLTAASADQQKAIKIKVQHKEVNTKNRQIIKRRRKTVVAAATDSQLDIGIGHKKLCFEDFLVTLSKSLSVQRVFPDDEKDAAILLMALSSGLVHV